MDCKLYEPNKVICKSFLKENVFGFNRHDYLLKHDKIYAKSCDTDGCKMSVMFGNKIRRHKDESVTTTTTAARR